MADSHYLNPTFHNQNSGNQSQTMGKEKESYSKRGLCCLWSLGLLIILALLISLILIATYSVLQYKKMPTYDESSKVTPLSCNQLRLGGATTSGIYYINRENSTQKVYCDMTTDGGGWTLIAAVNVVNPAERATDYDFWSYLGSDSQTVSGSISWIDEDTAGALTAAMRDYKSSAYFNLPASDVLVTHVPNFTPVRDYDRAAFFKYHTSNHFLDDYGSSLQTFFGQYAKLKRLTNVGIDRKIVNLIRNTGNLSSLVSSYYNYSYDGRSNYINNGGKNMLPNSGNRVYYSLNDQPFVPVDYDKTYTDSKTFHISSATIQPFVTLASVSSFDGYPSKFRLKVVHGSATQDLYRSRKIIDLNYKGMHISGRDFYTSSRNQSIISAILFQIRKNGFGSTVSFDKLQVNDFEIVTTLTKPRNALIGYVLLSRFPGTQFIADSEIIDVLKRIVDFTISASADIRDLHPRDDFVFPVNFVKGNLTYSGSNVTSGYLQFRAYDFYGAPYAMCPGVRVNNEDPSKYCIGSADTVTLDKQRCGDFSDWSSLPDHVFVNRSLSRGNFVNDMSSTIMIFTRNHKEPTP